MAWGECTDDSGNPLPVQSLSYQAGGNDVDVTKWGARRINLSIQDVQKTIQEGLSMGPIVPFNISGGNDTGDRVKYY